MKIKINKLTKSIDKLYDNNEPNWFNRDVIEHFIQDLLNQFGGEMVGEKMELECCDECDRATDSYPYRYNQKRQELIKICKKYGVKCQD